MNKKITKVISTFGAFAVFVSSLPLPSFGCCRRETIRTSTRVEEMQDVNAAILKLERRFGLGAGELAIVVDPSRQALYVVRGRKVILTFRVSTSKRGIGNVYNSLKTPHGSHRIKTKIGDGAPLRTIFKSRENMGRVAKFKKPYGGGITTRIMWLDGLEDGVNTNRQITEDTSRAPGHVDSFWRYIYIHGTPEESRIGRPGSIGCIEMKNAEIVELFNMVREGTLVEILNKPYRGD